MSRATRRAFSNTSATKRKLNTPNHSERSWQSGKVPEDYKKVNVIPIFKKSIKRDAGNYRPISFTSIPGKGMAQLILEAISKHGEHKEVIRNSQHGFTRGNLIAFYTETTSWTGVGRVVDVTNLDLSMLSK